MAHLEIPAQFKDWIKRAAIEEVKETAESLAGEAAAALPRIDEAAFASRHGREGADLRVCLSDFRGTGRYTADAIATAEAIFASDGGVVEGKASALAYVVEAMYRRVIPTAIVETAGPLEGEESTGEVALIAAATKWAGEEASRLHAEACFEQKGGDS
jgi:hypothetical protein